MGSLLAKLDHGGGLSIIEGLCVLRFEHIQEFVNFGLEGEALEGVLLPVVEEFVDTRNPCLFHCKLHKIIFKYSTPHNISLFFLPLLKEILLIYHRSAYAGTFPINDRIS